MPPRPTSRNVIRRPPVARYRDIAEDIKDRIAAGEFAPGGRLPPITALMEHNGVPGLNTIRQAQQLLVDDRTM